MMPSRKKNHRNVPEPPPLSLHPDRSCTMTIGLPHSPRIFSECLFTRLTCPCVHGAAWPGRIIRLRSCRPCPPSRVKKSPRPKGRLKCQERDLCPHIKLTYPPEALGKITSLPLLLSSYHTLIQPQPPLLNHSRARPQYVAPTQSRSATRALTVQAPKL